ncbi:MAG: YbaN family protein [Pseudoalteromonas prydzensis]|uniref:Inner membrane protein n=2 Tax=root TaxID=1 RepID=A0A7V1GE91_9GAMM|nr:YbaN family protein [Pseudoalteromonas prydzensis]HDY86214.1 DUF454 domain-containing protein [Methylophaga sp.]HEA16685.1 DUF454 domain-containing protein [Pseudoalteromonas prydzensis]
MKHTNKNNSMLVISKFKQVTYLLSGLFLTGMGILGAFLPVMPTTVFLIGAVFCFSRSSKRFESWLLNHPRFGKTLTNWQAHGAISKSAKVMASLGMAVGYGLFYLGAQPSLLLATVVALFMGGSAYYVLSRPLPPEDCS